MDQTVDRLEAAHAWELRGAWAGRWDVALSVDADVTHVRGKVEHVAATDAFVIIADRWSGGSMLVPCVRILAIRRPHFAEPVDEGPGQMLLGERYDGQMRLV